MTNPKIAACLGCGRHRRETAFGLFVLYLWPVQHGRTKRGLVKDKYFCDQACLDAYCGIIRDKDGYVVSEVGRYKTKLQFKGK